MAAEGLLIVGGSGSAQLKADFDLSAFQQFAVAQRAWLRRRQCTETDDLENWLTYLNLVSQ
jgi:hypothetical protein